MALAPTPGGRVGDTSSLARPGYKGKRRTTDYERQIAHALMRKGYNKSRAIAMARGLLNKAARSGRWGDHGKASGAVRAGAAASIAQRASFSNVAVSDTILSVTTAQKSRRTIANIAAAEAVRRLDAADVDLSVVTLTGDIDLGTSGAKWRHGWVPLNAVAAAMKAKTWKGGKGNGARGSLPSRPTKTRARFKAESNGRVVENVSRGKAKPRVRTEASTEASSVPPKAESFARDTRTLKEKRVSAASRVKVDKDNNVTSHTGEHSSVAPTKTPSGPRVVYNNGRQAEDINTGRSSADDPLAAAKKRGDAVKAARAERKRREAAVPKAAPETSAPKQSKTGYADASKVEPGDYVTHSIGTGKSMKTVTSRVSRGKTHMVDHDGNDMSHTGPGRARGGRVRDLSGNDRFATPDEIRAFNEKRAAAAARSLGDSDRNSLFATPPKPRSTKKDTPAMQAARTELADRLGASNPISLDGALEPNALKPGRAVSFKDPDGNTITGHVVQRQGSSVIISTPSRVYTMEMSTRRGTTRGTVLEAAPAPGSPRAIREAAQREAAKRAKSAEDAAFHAKMQEPMKSGRLPEPTKNEYRLMEKQSAIQAGVYSYVSEHDLESVMDSDSLHITSDTKAKAAAKYAEMTAAKKADVKKKLEGISTPQLQDMLRNGVGVDKYKLEAAREVLRSRGVTPMGSQGLIRGSAD